MEQLSQADSKVSEMQDRMPSSIRQVIWSYLDVKTQIKKIGLLTKTDRKLLTNSVFVQRNAEMKIALPLRQMIPVRNLSGFYMKLCDKINIELTFRYMKTHSNDWFQALDSIFNVVSQTDKKVNFTIFFLMEPMPECFPDQGFLDFLHVFRRILNSHVNHIKFESVIFNFNEYKFNYLHYRFGHIHDILGIFDQVDNFQAILTGDITKSRSNTGGYDSNRLHNSFNHLRIPVNQDLHFAFRSFQNLKKLTLEFCNKEDEKYFLAQLRYRQLNISEFAIVVRDCAQSFAKIKELIQEALNYLSTSQKLKTVTFDFKGEREIFLKDALDMALANREKAQRFNFRQERFAIDKCQQQFSMMLMGSYVMKKYNIAKDQIEKCEAITVEDTRLLIKHEKYFLKDFQRVSFTEDVKDAEPFQIMIDAQYINISHR